MITYREAPITESLHDIPSTIPELHHVPKLRITMRIILLVAESQGEWIGFKLGYPLQEQPSVFYSWLGGVHPDFRGQGIARHLLQQQESLVTQRGFTTIRVKSMNRYPAILHLLISEQYQIYGTEQSNLDVKFCSRSY